MLTIELNMYHAVALGAFLFWMGGIITDKVRLLNRYCIPAPLVGGLCFSVLNCILYSTGIASITFDGTLQTVFMILFFTTVGFTVSIPALLKGGKAVMLCLIVSIVMIPLQNFLGGGVMEVFGCDPLLGIGCGSIALIGGPGTAAAFGPDLEAAGAVGGIGGTYAAMPELYERIFTLVRGGGILPARDIQDACCHIIYKMCSGQGNMYAMIKEILRLRGAPDIGGVRAPLYPLQPGDEAIAASCAADIDAAIAQFCC